MAIGLSNVNNRKAKRPVKTVVADKPQQPGHRQSQQPQAAIAAELKSEVWSSRGLAREGRSIERERKVASGDLNTTWLDWTACVTGSESSSRVLNTIRRMLDLEASIFDFFATSELRSRCKIRP